MSLTIKRRELKNARMYFIPAGTILALGAGEASLTISQSTAFPDNTPPTNYTDWEFDDIEEVKEALTLKSEDFSIRSDTGGYVVDDEGMVTKREYSATSHKTNALIKQLQHGLAALPVVGVAQALGANKKNSLEGVLLIEIMEHRLGAVTERLSMWARFKVKSAGDVGPATAKVEISFAMLPHTANSYVLVA